jgi:hypothetical protein
MKSDVTNGADIIKSYNINTEQKSPVFKWRYGVIKKSRSHMSYIYSCEI